MNYAGAGLLHVFTSNAPPLEPDTSYSKFVFVAAVEHGGDFAEAARQLRAQGYGQRPLPGGRRRRPTGRGRQSNSRGGRRRPRRR